MAPFDRLHTSSCWRSIATIALSCIISDTMRDIGQILQLFIPHLHLTPRLGWSPVEYCHEVWYGKIRMVWLLDGEESLMTFSHFDKILACDRQTDRRTDILRKHSPCYACTSCSIICLIFMYYFYNFTNFCTSDTVVTPMCCNSFLQTNQ